jgi:hypothetical protein
VAEWLRRQTQVLVLFEGVSSNLTGCNNFFWSTVCEYTRFHEHACESSWYVSGPSHNVDGCIAQSVERWSNKPLVKGSSPFVTIFVFVFSSALVSLCIVLIIFATIFSVAFVAERLRRYVQVVVHFVGVGSSPTECNTFFFFLVFRPTIFCIVIEGVVCLTTKCAPVRRNRSRTETIIPFYEIYTHTRNMRQSKRMAVPGFEPGSSGSQPLMLTTTLYHQ